MRNWIDLFEAKVTDGVWTSVTTRQMVELAARHDLRGIGSQNQVYIWPAHDAVHRAMMHRLGIASYSADTFCFYVAPAAVPYEYDDEAPDDTLNGRADWVADGARPTFVVQGTNVYVEQDSRGDCLQNRGFARMVGQPLAESTIMEREQSTLNSRGQIIAKTPEAIMRFWQWFGRSKAKTRAGQPLVLFHGTTGVFRSFDPEMSNSHTNTGVPHSTFAFSDNPEVATSYITLDADKKDFATPELKAEYMALIKNGSFDDQLKFLHDNPLLPTPEYKPGGTVMPVYLRLLKPLVVDAKGDHWHDIYFQPKDYRHPESFTTNEIAEYAHDNGFDGLVIKNVKDVHKGEAHVSTVYCAFSPQQIKSVTANSGLYGAGNMIDEEAN